MLLIFLTCACWVEHCNADCALRRVHGCDMHVFMYPLAYR